MSTQIASPVAPDLRALLDSFKQEVMVTLNAHSLGEVVSYDATKATCTVKVKILRQFNGTYLEYPILTDCPVFQIMGGPTYISVPITAGDPCLILFNDWDIDNWFTTGNTAVPNTPRTHSLSDGLVLVGFRNLAKTPPVTSSDSLLLIHNTANARVTVGATTSMTIGSQQVTLKANGKVSIANSAGDQFRTAMDSLFTALTAWVNTGGSTPNATTVTAINSAKTAFDAIFDT
jgi:hypothetical protein